MLFSKLRAGILCLDTPQGKRYIRPSFVQCLKLWWVFRNFKIVPVNVLSRSEAQMVNYLRLHGSYVEFNQHEFEIALLGTIEYPQHAEQRPPKPPSHRLADVVTFAPRKLATLRANSSRQTRG